ncbi:hypothetical protein GCM10007939_09070 [Amylibacter marinus]|uniref:YHS domain-containing protein n=1 Tax=Amylibacter marinus TaxID=1475483 RepID=A0ABQ5VTZ0_9RHOB|nr:YHS domain-containing (seleno)protein [Amylibacter marinus]GLQ34624.1 hypothetical protein GCM10007939_09070 [Amylibacter marinus]
MKITRRITLAFLASLPLAGVPAWADTSEIYVGNNGFAINGFDAVAYFTQSDHVMGDEAHQTSYNGATFLFSSAQNKSTFEADPEKYAPQYGGYCAFAVSKGAIAKSDPDAWTIVDGKLYMNFDLQVRHRWRQDIPGNIAKADKNWPGVLN